MRRESLLKVLLRRRHLQTHAAFTAAYERTARELDRDLIGTAPGREQLQRWLGARVKTTPRSHHCRVLERMFPGYRVEELLAPYGQDRPTASETGAASPSSPQDGGPVESPTTRPTTRPATGTASDPATDPLPCPPNNPPNNRTGPRAIGAADGPTGRSTTGATDLPASSAAPHEPGDARDGGTGRDRAIGPTTGPTGPMVSRGADELEQLLDAGTVGRGRLGFLEGEADRLGVEVVRVPPSTLLEATCTHLRSVHGLLAERQPVAVAAELARIATKLATVVAEILWNENQLTLATRWYHAALRAANESGDRTLADIALAGSTYIPAYTEHPRTVLANVDPRLSTATATRPASPAIAWLWGFKARAHASLGEADTFEHAIQAARETLQRSPAETIRPGIFSFVPEKLAFYEAHGRVELGDWQGAIQAAERALAGYDPTETTEPTLTRLELASAVAQSGDPTEACDLATRALLDPSSYHSAAVVLQARAFDRRLGPTTRATAGWRDFLAGIHPPDATALAPSM